MLAQIHAAKHFPLIHCLHDSKNLMTIELIHAHDQGLFSLVATKIIDKYFLKTQQVYPS